MNFLSKILKCLSRELKFFEFYTVLFNNACPQYGHKALRLIFSIVEFHSTRSYIMHLQSGLSALWLHMAINLPSGVSRVYGFFGSMTQLRQKYAPQAERVLRISS